MNDEDFDAVLDACAGCVTGQMLDRLLTSLKMKVANPALESVRYVSHSIQTAMYPQMGFRFAESETKRLTEAGIEWLVDDGLPLDCIVIESEFGNGLLKNLYPSCPVCWRRLESA